MAVTKIQTIDNQVEEYDKLRVQKKQIEDRMKVLADEIKSYASLNGTKDDKGSYYAENEKYNFGSQCKKSIKLNEDRVLKYFKADKNLASHIQTKEYVSEDTVEALSADGTISYEDLEALCDTKVTYSISVVKKEEVTAEVEEKTVAMPIAASKKPKLRPKKRK